MKMAGLFPWKVYTCTCTLLHSKRPKLYGVLTILSAKGLSVLSEHVYVYSLSETSLFTNVVPGNDVTCKGCLGSVLCHVCYNGLWSNKLFCYV